MTARQLLGLVGIAMAAMAIAACGGGAASDNKPVVEASCAAQVKSGFGTAGDPSANGGEADADGDGVGTGDGGGGGGAVGAGGALGKFRNARLEVWVGNSNTGRGITDGRGLATIEICEADLDKPHTIKLVGTPGATYFDEGVGKFVEFKTGESISVQVPNMRRKFLGITTFTNASSSVTTTASTNPDLAAKYHSSPKALAKAIDEDNKTVASILADQLPGNFRSGSGDGLFEITGLPVSLDDTTISTANSIPNNSRGRYSAANAGFSVQSGIFLPGEPRPAFIGAAQLASDLSDGKLDMVNAAGCTVATAPETASTAEQSARHSKDACSGTVGDRLAYTYESLWRTKTIATNDIASGAGDAELKKLEAQIAEYTTNAQRIIKVDHCRRPNGGSDCSAPFYPRSDVRQTVKLNSRGRLSIQREASTRFAPGIGWIGNVIADLPVSNTVYVDVRVGSNGQIVAIHSNRQKITFYPAPQPYHVTGTEYNKDDAIKRMKQTLSQQGNYDITFDKAIISAVIPPTERSDSTNQGIPLFIAVFSDGSFAQISGTNTIHPRALPYAISGIAYDKFIPPGYNTDYGPQTNLGNYPFDGPRRQFVLTRQGQVRVMLEGNTSRPGVLLDVPGRVIQLAAESRANVYALNSDGQVFWLNADQTLQHPLHTVFQVNIPGGEKMCWVARRDAVACKSGTVYQWKEALKQIEFRPSGQAGARNITFAPVGIEPAQALNLNGQAIWRLNSVDEFYLSGTASGSFRSDGIRYLPVNGKPFDPTVTSSANRSLHNSKCDFFFNDGTSALNKPYLHGWQIRRALKAAFKALKESPAHTTNNWARLDTGNNRAASIDSRHGFSTIFSADTNRQITLGPAGRSDEQSNCRQTVAETGKLLGVNQTHHKPTDQEIASQGFSPLSFTLTSTVGPLNGSNQIVGHRELPTFKAIGKFAENQNGFFIDFDTGSIPGEARNFYPTNNIYVWSDNARYRLDQGLVSWEYDYGSQAATGNPDRLDIYRNERSGATVCAESSEPERCMKIKIVPRAVFDNPNQYRMCFDMGFNTTVPSHTVRLVCTVHEFDGSFVKIDVLENWEYPPRSELRPTSQIDFGFLLSRPN